MVLVFQSITACTLRADLTTFNLFHLDSFKRTIANTGTNRLCVGRPSDSSRHYKHTNGKGGQQLLEKAKPPKRVVDQLDRNQRNAVLSEISS